MNYHDLKIGIVGAGAVGVSLAVALTHAGYNVELVCEESNCICIGNSKVYSIFGDFGDMSYLVPTVTNIKDFSSKKDFIIFATKAYDTINLVKDAIPQLSKVGAIVTIQNAFCIDRLMKVIPRDKSICMYLDIYCKSFPLGKLVINSNGLTLGVYDKNAFSKMKVLKHVLDDICNVNLTNNVFGFILGRNILSAAIALLGAISGLQLGKILKNKRGKFLFNKIIEEAMYVMKKYRIKVLPYNNQLDYYLFTSRDLKGLKYNKDMINVLRKNNRNIRSSLLTDIEKGRKTELEFILGNFYNYSSKSKSQTPYINAIYKMVKEIEEGTRRVHKNAFLDEALNISNDYKKTQHYDD